MEGKPASHPLAQVQRFEVQVTAEAQMQETLRQPTFLVTLELSLAQEVRLPHRFQFCVWVAVLFVSGLLKLTLLTLPMFQWSELEDLQRREHLVPL